MITKIRKRDGREVPFNSEKIVNAIFKAAASIGGSDFNKAIDLAGKVVEQLEIEYGKKVPGVEQVQDVVEKVLIDEGHAKTAKQYILYRAERSRAREMNTRLMKVFEDLTYKDSSENDLKRENANIDGDTAMGTMLRYGSEAAKQFYEMFILNPKHSEAHKSGDIHIHDMDFLTLTTTCCQIDICKLFENGFSTGHGFLREPNDIQSYSALACIAIQSNQNDQHGGQSIPNFDYGMAKGVKKSYKKIYFRNLKKALELLLELEDASKIVSDIKSKMTKEPTLMNVQEYQKEEEIYLKEIIDDKDIINKIQRFVYKNTEKDIDRATYQAMEAFIHNLNTMHSRAGAQIPFSSINYGTDTSKEGRLVMKNLLLATKAGLGNGETPIFPI